MSSSISGALLPDAEPFEHAGGPVGVLLCHGFTGSPQTLRTWAEYVAGQGFSVSLPRLPGHGTTWQDLARTGWQDWYAEVDAAFGVLARRCEQTFVFGLSMGGCLALRLAEVHGSAVRGLVLVNPSLAADTKLLVLAPVLKYLPWTVPGIASDIKKPGASEVGYDRVPLRCREEKSRIGPRGAMSVIRRDPGRTSHCPRRWPPRHCRGSRHDSYRRIRAP